MQCVMFFCYARNILCHRPLNSSIWGCAASLSPELLSYLNGDLASCDLPSTITELLEFWQLLFAYNLVLSNSASLGWIVHCDCKIMPVNTSTRTCFSDIWLKNEDNCFWLGLRSYKEQTSLWSTSRWRWALGTWCLSDVGTWRKSWPAGTFTLS